MDAGDKCTRTHQLRSPTVSIHRGGRHNLIGGKKVDFGVGERVRHWAGDDSVVDVVVTDTRGNQF